MRSTACWTRDAQARSASHDPRRGWGQCPPIPDPCTTLAPATADLKDTLLGFWVYKIYDETHFLSLSYLERIRNADKIGTAVEHVVLVEEQSIEITREVVMVLDSSSVGNAQCLPKDAATYLPAGG